MNEQSISPSRYDRDYYLRSCDGYRDFLRGQGLIAGWRFQRAIDAARVGAGDTVLDIGCGRGEIPIQIALRGARGIGMDYSADSMALCREASSLLDAAVCDRIRFVRADARLIPFRAGAFDRVFILDLIEHLHPPELDALAGELMRVLKTGGAAVIHTSPNRRYFDVGYRVRWRIHRVVCALPGPLRTLLFGEVPPLPRENPREAEGAGPDTHVNEMTVSRLRSFMRRNGFEGAVWLECDPPVYRGHSIFRRWTWVHRLLDLWPLGHLFPLRHLFAPHIFAVLRKR